MEEELPAELATRPQQAGARAQFDVAANSRKQIEWFYTCGTISGQTRARRLLYARCELGTFVATAAAGCRHHRLHSSSSSSSSSSRSRRRSSSSGGGCSAASRKRIM
eukprot:COSAG06_NODE_653_length_13364_cov_3.847041_12_plen_107_part_00